MSNTRDSLDSRAADVGMLDPDRTGAGSRAGAAVPESDDDRDERIVREEFEGLDNDLVDVAKFSEGDEGSGRVDDNEVELGRPDDEQTDTAELSVSEYDRSGKRR